MMSKNLVTIGLGISLIPNDTKPITWTIIDINKDVPPMSHVSIPAHLY